MENKINILIKKYNKFSLKRIFVSMKKKLNGNNTIEYLVNEYTNNIYNEFFLLNLNSDSSSIEQSDSCDLDINFIQIAFDYIEKISEDYINNYKTKEKIKVNKKPQVRKSILKNKIDMLPNSDNSRKTSFSKKPRISFFQNGGENNKIPKKYEKEKFVKEDNIKDEEKVKKPRVRKSILKNGADFLPKNLESKKKKPRISFFQNGGENNKIPKKYEKEKFVKEDEIVAKKPRVRNSILKNGADFLPKNPESNKKKPRISFFQNGGENNKTPKKYEKEKFVKEDDIKDDENVKKPRVRRSILKNGPDFNLNNKRFSENIKKKPRISFFQNGGEINKIPKKYEKEKFIKNNKISDDNDSDHTITSEDSNNKLTKDYLKDTKIINFSKFYSNLNIKYNGKNKNNEINNIIKTLEEAKNTRNNLLSSINKIDSFINSMNNKINNFSTLATHKNNNTLEEKKVNNNLNLNKSNKITNKITTTLKPIKNKLFNKKNYIINYKISNKITVKTKQSNKQYDIEKQMEVNDFIKKINEDKKLRLRKKEERKIKLLNKISKQQYETQEYHKIQEEKYKEYEKNKKMELLKKISEIQNRKREREETNRFSNKVVSKLLNDKNDLESNYNEDFNKKKVLKSIEITKNIQNRQIINEKYNHKNLIEHNLKIRENHEILNYKKQLKFLEEEKKNHNTKKYTYYKLNNSINKEMEKDVKKSAKQELIERKNRYGQYIKEYHQPSVISGVKNDNISNSNRINLFSNYNNRDMKKRATSQMVNRKKNRKVLKSNYVQLNNRLSSNIKINKNYTNEGNGSVINKEELANYSKYRNNDIIQEEEINNAPDKKESNVVFSQNFYEELNKNNLRPWLFK